MNKGSATPVPRTARFARGPPPRIFGLLQPCIPIGITFSIIVKLAKSKLNSMEVLISKALIDLHFIHDEFVLINNVLKKFYDMKEENKNLNYR